MCNRIMAFLKKYKAALLILLSSRLLVYGIAWLTAQYGFGPVSFVQWDARAYLYLAQFGYVYDPSYLETASYIAYFPLLPMLIAFVHHITFLSYALSAQIVSFLSLGGAVLLLYKIVSEWKGEKVAKIAIALLCFFPHSIFLTAAYTEGLFLLIILAAYHFLKKDKYLLSAILIGLATITRIVGSVFGIVFIIEVWRRTHSVRKLILPACIAAFPFGLYLVFQYFFFGTAKAFLLAQHLNWNQHAVFPWEGFANFYYKVFTFDWMPVMWRIDGIFLAIMIFTLIISFKKVPVYFWLGGVFSILLILSSSDITGMSRYMMLIIPFYFYWANVLEKRPLLTQIILTLFGGFMVFNTVLYVLGKNIF